MSLRIRLRTKRRKAIRRRLAYYRGTNARLFRSCLPVLQQFGVSCHLVHRSFERLAEGMSQADVALYRAVEADLQRKADADG